MDQIWVKLLLIALLILVSFLIYLLLELRKSAKALTHLLKTAEDSLKPTLDELQMTLKSVRKVTDDVNSVTENVRLATSSAKDIGQNLKRISGFLDEVSTETMIKVSGLRVGIKTALEVLLKNFLLKKGDH